MGVNFDECEIMVEEAERIGIRGYIAPPVKSGERYLDEHGRIAYQWSERAGEEDLRKAVDFVRRNQGKGEGRMIKIDIINQVSKDAEISKGKAEIAVETIFSTMKNALKNGERIELRGFGVFEVKARKTGIGRNPRTGDIVPIAPGKKVRFKPGKEIKNL